MTTRARKKDGRGDEFLMDVPAAIIEEEWQTYDAERREAVRKSGLYDVKTDAEMRPAKKDGE